MDWFTTDWATLWRIALSAALVLAATIAAIRANGLRSLSKMSSFDFAVTVAIGSIVASTVLSKDPSVPEGAIAVVSLLICQRLVAAARLRLGASALVDNSPIVLMRGTELVDDALKRSRVTADDVYAKLREANVTSLEQVHLVVLESTGDISVLHGEPGAALDERLMRGVEGRETSGAAGGTPRPA